MTPCHTPCIQLAFIVSPFHSFFTLYSSSLCYTMAAFESGRQFHVDRFTSQTFYREPINGVYSPWMPLHASDYHPSRPEAHDVKNHVNLDHV